MAYIEIQGYVELDKALRELQFGLARGFREELKDASEPARIRSEQLAMSEISGMKRWKTVNWSEFRLGATQQGVYLAPAHRRKTGKPRKNLAGLLMGKAMRPGAEQTMPEIAISVDRVLDSTITQAGF